MLGDLSHVENIYIRTGYPPWTREHRYEETAEWPGGRQSAMKGTDFAFCTNSMKADASNGPEPMNKASLIS